MNLWGHLAKNIVMLDWIFDHLNINFFCVLVYKFIVCRDGSELSTRDMQKLVQALPQYSEQMEKLTLHVEVCFNCSLSQNFHIDILVGYNEHLRLYNLWPSRISHYWILNFSNYINSVSANNWLNVKYKKIYGLYEMILWPFGNGKRNDWYFCFIQIAGKINKIITDTGLRDLGQLEQDLVFGDAGTKEVINFIRKKQVRVFLFQYNGYLFQILVICSHLTTVFSLYRIQHVRTNYGWWWYMHQCILKSSRVIRELNWCRWPLISFNDFFTSACGFDLYIIMLMDSQSEAW